jgi:hypothetical protein
VPPRMGMAALAIRTTPAVCEDEGPIITGPIISNTLLLFAIGLFYPIMVLSQIAVQDYFIFWNLSVFFVRIRGFVCLF